GAMAPWSVIQPEFFFRWTVPAWVAGALGNLLLGSLLAVLASEQLEGFDSRRPALRRGVATLGWTVAWLMLGGGVIGYAARGSGWPGGYNVGVAGNHLAPLFLILSLMLSFFAVPFVTGTRE